MNNQYSRYSDQLQGDQKDLLCELLTKFTVEFQKQFML